MENNNESQPIVDNNDELDPSLIEESKESSGVSVAGHGAIVIEAASKMISDLMNFTWTNIMERFDWNKTV